MNEASERFTTRDAVVGDNLPIRRAIPQPRRRMIGAWCFLDHAGPVTLTSGPGMRVGPHPHIGLQTFTWPLEGELLHRDSLGTEQLIVPGQVNLMTAGQGIAHSEESPASRSGRLHLAQLWIALPDAQRNMPPQFAHYPQLPVLGRDAFRITVLAGEAFDARSPVGVFSPLLGLDIAASGPAHTVLPLDLSFEHGLLVLDGAVLVDDEPLLPGTLLYLPPGAAYVAITSNAPARLLLLGGLPFEEPVLLWWNFVARSRDEIAQATDDWNSGLRFGAVHGFDGPRLTAPEVPALTVRRT
ncbi:pirin family protein [Tahibacter amnicola]|uniref:Pirin family protein n=1 Tax=Tahibacter amnicola TaxID=2976241 RepID=A0ABY6B9N1_9GAMM|nr:pirin family protein [Tahibacter amnicola]UXI66262.1 pirin family protein [Tahibacter amnicola]